MDIDYNSGLAVWLRFLTALSTWIVWESIGIGFCWSLVVFMAIVFCYHANKYMLRRKNEKTSTDNGSCCWGW